MFPSSHLMKLVVLVGFICLVGVECRNPRRRSSISYRHDLWNPNNNEVSSGGGGGGPGVSTPIGNGNEGGGGSSGGYKPRFGEQSGSDYETGYATGLAMKKALGLTKIVLSPIVLPMIFIVGIALLVFFAVVGSSAVIGGSLGRHRRHPYKLRPMNYGWGNEFSSRTARLASDVLNSDECIERLSCEVFKNAKSFGMENLINSAISEMPSNEGVIGRISRSIKNPTDCQKFTCASLSLASRAVKAFQG